MERVSSKKAKAAGSNPARSTKHASQNDESIKYELIARIDESLIIAKVNIQDLREQDRNARYMPDEMFRQLTKNIENRGVLESTPYCCLTENGIEIISGHHRIRSLLAAKLNKPLYILLETKPMSRSEITAKQLAHNSIAGCDDPAILKEMYLSIDEANLRLMAFIDEKKLELPEPANVQITSLNTGLDLRNVKLLFLPYQLEDFIKVCDLLEGDEEKLFVASLEHWPRFKEAVNKLMAEEDIRSIGTAVARMSEITLQHLEQKS